ncbi:MAG: prepilin-type N-terminal cleavage/methylation domain-containing protein [Candidatus Omnitrophota bacterium]
MKKQGFTLVELLVGIGILVIIALIGLVVIAQVSQRTKAVVAKLTIAQYAMLLETVKEDINHYPDDEACTTDSGTLQVLTSTLSQLRTEPYVWDYQANYRGWNGPYLKAEQKLDPWKTLYFYVLNVEPDNFLTTVQLYRTTGAPNVYSFSFTSPVDSGTLVVINGAVSSGSITLNGTEVVAESELKSDVTKIEKAVTLKTFPPDTNTLVATLRGIKDNWIIVTVKSANPSPFEEPTAYTMGSRGADRQPGGTGLNKDIIWVSGQSGGGF